MLTLHEGCFRVLLKVQINPAIGPAASGLDHLKSLATECLADQQFKFPPGERANRIKAGLPRVELPAPEFADRGRSPGGENQNGRHCPEGQPVRGQAL